MFSGQPGHRLAATLDIFVRAVCVAALVAASLDAGSARAAQAIGPTVRDVVEFTRIVHPLERDADTMQSLVSPDGRAAFIVTRQANTGTDRNRYRILLFDVRPEVLAAGRAAPPLPVATIDPVIDDNSAYPSVQDLQWAGPRTIVFRARIADAVFQVYQVDTETRQLTQLTFSPESVVSFAISEDLKRVVCTVQIDNPPLAPGRRAVVVGNQSFWSIKFGQTDKRSQRRMFQHFVAESGSRGPMRRLGEPFEQGGTAKPPVSISPDGRWALLPRYEPERQLAWGEMYPLVAEATARLGPAVSIDPLGYFARPVRYVPRRLVAYRLADGAGQTVVDAPDDTTGHPRADVVWQPGGKSVIVAGTHLPPEGSAQGARGSHVVEYWPDSGRWDLVTALKGRLSAVHRVGAGPDAFALIDEGGRRIFQRGADGRWREQREAASTSGGWTLQLKEGLDLPPDIVARGPDGQTVRLTELNPQVSPAWGTVRPYVWKDARGRDWNGGLLLPANHDSRVRQALVIQTYGFAPDRFYLDGANQVPGFTSGFAGRAFLREKLLVLAFPVRASTNAPSSDAAAIAAYMEGVRAAIDALVADGLVDRNRIGIMGWSMTGERVLNLVTFSDAPIRAAAILDGDANTLFSLTVTYGYSDSITARKERTNLSLPYGDTLDTWIRHDPALNTDCIRAALRIETYGPWVLNNWDIYALLRRQYKPAEMVVIPGGSHGLLTPSERMISLQGNVDWFRFWLNGEARTEPMLWGEDAAALQDQYRRWQEMAGLKRADDARPDCARKRAGGG